MMKMPEPLCFVFCVFATYSANLLSSPANSAENDLFQLSLEQLVDINVNVITPSKIEEPLSQSPGIVSVFTDKEIALFGARDLGEVLSRIAGIQPYDSLNAGRFRLSIRGDLATGNNNHVLMLLNGTPFNRESYTGGIWTQANILTVPLPLIKRIEVSRGPGSVLYGTNAFSGVVNIITKESDELDDEVTVSYGNDNTKAVDVSYATSKGDLNITAAGRYFDTDGWDHEITSTAGDKFSDSAFSKSPGFMATAKFRDLYATVAYGKADQYTIRGIATAPASGDVENEKFFLDLGFDHTFSNDWQLKSSASYVSGRTDLKRVAIGGGLENIHYETDDGHIEITGQGPLSDNFHLLLGSSVDIFTGHVIPPSGSAPFLPDWEDYLYGLYGQVEYRLANTKVTVGAQYNKLEGISGNIVPRLALVHNFTSNFGFKALYGQAFRAPSTVERGINSTTGLSSFTGDPSLSPELVTNYDLQLFYTKDQLQASMTLFKSEQEDLIARVATSPTSFVFQNTGGLDIEGIEFESKFTFRENWYFTGSYTYQTNEDSDGVKNATLQANTIIKLGLAYNSKNWSVGIFDSYFDQYHDNNSPNKNNPSPKAYHDLSVNASLTLPKFHDITLSAYMDNLLDENAYLPIHTGNGPVGANTLQTQSGRSFFLGLTVPF